MSETGGGLRQRDVANDLVGLMHAFGHERFAVVGVDTGCVIPGIGRWLAGQAPEQLVAALTPFLAPTGTPRLASPQSALEAEGGHHVSRNLPWRGCCDGTRLHAVSKGGQMPKVSRTSGSHVQDYGPLEERRGDVEGTAIQFLTTKQDLDATPLMKGLPDD